MKTSASAFCVLLSVFCLGCAAGSTTAVVRTPQGVFKTSRHGFGQLDSGVNPADVSRASMETAMAREMSEWGKYCRENSIPPTYCYGGYGMLFSPYGLYLPQNYFDTGQLRASEFRTLVSQPEPFFVTAAPDPATSGAPAASGDSDAANDGQDAAALGARGASQQAIDNCNKKLSLLISWQGKHERADIRDAVALYERCNAIRTLVRETLTACRGRDVASRLGNLQNAVSRICRETANLVPQH